MLKTWGRGIGLALCLFACTTAAIASSYPEADRYFGVRDKSRLVVQNVTFDQVQANAALWKDALIEIRGTVRGCAKRDDGGTIIIERDAGDTVVIDALQKLPEQTLDLGRTVRVLARVPPDHASFSSLQLVSATSEYDAASLEIERGKHPTAPRPLQIARRAPRAAPMPRHLTRRQRAALRRAALHRSRMQQTMLASRGLDLLSRYSAAVRWFNPSLPESDARRLAQSIIYYSWRYGLDARLIMAVIAVESNFNSTAVSPKGAMGLGQLMPGTASGLGVANPWSPEQNIEGATRLLRGHLNQVGAPGGPIQAPTWDQIRLALACYNAGAGAVRKYRGVPPYRETKNYIRKIGRLYFQMCGLTPPPE